MLWNCTSISPAQGEWFVVDYWHLPNDFITHTLFSISFKKM